MFQCFRLELIMQMSTVLQTDLQADASSAEAVCNACSLYSILQ